MKMKRSDYCNIASYSELREVRRENERTLKNIKSDMSLHSGMLVKQFSPKSIWKYVMHYISPLRSVYRYFRK